jgi:hypothetical protein
MGHNPNVPKYPFDLKKPALLDEAGCRDPPRAARFSLQLAFEAGGDNSDSRCRFAARGG